MPASARLTDTGAALVSVLMATALLVALAGGAVLTTTLELAVAAAWRDSEAALHAAGAALEMALDELAAVPDLTPVLDGTRHSIHRDGPAGSRRLPGGRTVDLVRETNLLRCVRAACTEAQVRAATDSRPWGAGNPRWEPFLHAPLAGLVGEGAGEAAGETTVEAYVAVWVGDDPAETDGDPRRDGSGAGQGRLLVRARAWGPSGVARTIEVLAARTAGALEVLRWAEIR